MSPSQHPSAVEANLATLPAAFVELVGQLVVLDVSGPFVYLGRLDGGDAVMLSLRQADVHDLRDTSTTREEYVLTARKFGVNPNRKRVLVRMEEVVSASRLEDVIV